MSQTTTEKRMHYVPGIERKENYIENFMKEYGARLSKAGVNREQLEGLKISQFIQLRQILDDDKLVDSLGKINRIFGIHIAISVVYWSNKFNVDPYTIASLIVAENSSFKDYKEKNIDIVQNVGSKLRRNPNYYSNKKYGTARGILQITPLAYKQIAEDESFEKVSKNYDLSIKYAAMYVKYIENYFNKKGITPSYKIIAAAYNMGPKKCYERIAEGNFPKTNIEKFLTENSPKTTKEYIDKFLIAYNKIEMLV